MGIVDTTKTVYDLVQAGATIELREQLMQMRSEALDVQEEILALRQRVADLEAAAVQADELTVNRGVYWRPGEDVNVPDGPFCTRCFDVETHVVRLQDYGDGWNCANCQAYYSK